MTAFTVPAGWLATNLIGTGAQFATSTVGPDSPPNSIFLSDEDGLSDKVLETPSFIVTSASTRVSFRNSYNMEFDLNYDYDGCVLEVSSPNVNGGAFTDITNPTVGGIFVAGGYNVTILGGASNPLEGRMAWGRNSGGYITTTVNLGANLNGQRIKLRFRMGTDEATSAPGWHIDGFLVQDFACPLQSAASRKVHGGAGAFDINLPFDATALLSGPGIEGRSGGATNDYEVVFTFASPVTFTAASLTTGAGSVSSASGSGTSTVAVNLTGITNAQRIKVTLSGVNNGSRTGDIGAPMGLLVGDTTANGTANASDVAQTKAQVGQTVSGTNFRTDTNVNGAITAADVSFVKAAIGTSLPPAVDP